MSMRKNSRPKRKNYWNVVRMLKHARKFASASSETQTATFEPATSANSDLLSGKKTRVRGLRSNEQTTG